MMKLLISLFSMAIMFLIVIYCSSFRTRSSQQAFPLTIEGLNKNAVVFNFGDDRKTRSIEVNNFWISNKTKMHDFDVAFLGTSRTKYLRPTLTSEMKALVVGGNSYSEIAYGSLVEAEILRSRFPNIKKFFIEASLLQRRCAGLYAEADHQKYKNWLYQLKPFWINYVPSTEIEKFFLRQSSFKINRALIKQAGSLKISKLFGLEELNSDWHKFYLTELDSLNPYGEYPFPSVNKVEKKDMIGVLSLNNPKVERIVHAGKCIPGSNAFKAFAEWGLAHNLKIVFYQPPVRSDLLEFKLKNGLSEHNADLISLANSYKMVKFVNMNHKKNNINEKWEYFSDEDHMNTCHGSVALTSALIDEEKQLVDQKYVDVDFNRYLAPERLIKFCH